MNPPLPVHMRNALAKETSQSRMLPTFQPGILSAKVLVQVIFCTHLHVLLRWLMVCMCLLNWGPLYLAYSKTQVGRPLQ